MVVSIEPGGEYKTQNKLLVGHLVLCQGFRVRTLKNTSPSVLCLKEEKIVTSKCLSGLILKL